MPGACGETFSAPLPLSVERDRAASGSVPRLVSSPSSAAGARSAAADLSHAALASILRDRGTSSTAAAAAARADGAGHIARCAAESAARLFAASRVARQLQGLAAPLCAGGGAGARVTLGFGGNIDCSPSDASRAGFVARIPPPRYKGIAQQGWDPSSFSVFRAFGPDATGWVARPSSCRPPVGSFAYDVHAAIAILVGAVLVRVQLYDPAARHANCWSDEPTAAQKRDLRAADASALQWARVCRAFLRLSVMGLLNYRGCDGRVAASGDSTAPPAPSAALPASLRFEIAISLPSEALIDGDALASLHARLAAVVLKHMVLQPLATYRARASTQVAALYHAVNLISCLQAADDGAGGSALTSALSADAIRASRDLVQRLALACASGNHESRGRGEGGSMPLAHFADGLAPAYPLVAPLLAAILQAAGVDGAHDDGINAVACVGVRALYEGGAVTVEAQQTILHSLSSASALDALSAAAGGGSLSPARWRQLALVQRSQPNDAGAAASSHLAAFASAGAAGFLAMRRLARAASAAHDRAKSDERQPAPIYARGAHALHTASARAGADSPPTLPLADDDSRVMPAARPLLRIAPLETRAPARGRDRSRRAQSASGGGEEAALEEGAEAPEGTSSEGRKRHRRRRRESRDAGTAAEHAALVPSADSADERVGEGRSRRRRRANTSDHVRDAGIVRVAGSSDAAGAARASRSRVHAALASPPLLPLQGAAAAASSHAVVGSDGDGGVEEDPYPDDADGDADAAVDAEFSAAVVALESSAASISAAVSALAGAGGSDAAPEASFAGETSASASIADGTLLADMTRAQLRVLCKARNISSFGSKEHLLQALAGCNTSAAKRARR